MPRLILFTIICAVVVMALKMIKKESSRVALRVRRSEQERQTGAKATLVKDPHTGEYHVDRG